jgi:hypothetical protein
VGLAGSYTAVPMALTMLACAVSAGLALLMLASPTRRARPDAA